ncbi:carbohydrate kinase family protein [bacterium]|nr:carbohydrate kinase family protein [bacterium]
MAAILVSGLINIETTLRIAEFPLTYNPVNFPFDGIHSSVSGVGYNLSKALTRLGNQVEFLSIIGRSEFAAELVRQTLAQDSISDTYVLSQVDHTAQSVILYTVDGKRQIHVDLKDIQQSSYPLERFAAAAQKCDLLALCNINFSRNLLVPARSAGKLVACDVHTIGSLDDAYNLDFMQAADILFMSHENLPLPPEEWAQAVQARFHNSIIVIGLGEDGCLLAVRQDESIQRIPAVYTRPVVNSIGAGDALFSAFLHGFAAHHDPYRALRTAVIFASYKIGAVSAADGFLTAPELENWVGRVYGN